MNNVKMSTGREVVNPLANGGNQSSFESESCANTLRQDRVVDNTSYGNCPKCSKAMPLVKNANHRNVFYCESCRTAAPCKE